MKKTAIYLLAILFSAPLFGQVFDSIRINTKIKSYQSGTNLKFEGFTTGEVEILDSLTTPFITINEVSFDGTDGTNGQALITNGSGVVSFGDVAAGDVTGPASSTDNAFVRFDGTTGKIIQNSGATLSDAGLAAFTNVEVGGSPVVVDSDIGSTVQAWDAQLDDISGLAVTDGNIIVGDGTNWVAESGATARTSLGAGDVNGPGSSTDNTIPRFDGTSGKLIQGSSVEIDDSGVIIVGGTSYTSNSPSVILENERSPAANSHGFVDSQVITGSTGSGHNSFDAFGLYNGSNNYDHVAGFQARPSYQSSGDINRLTGYQSMIDHEGAGTVTRLTHYEARDYTGAGTATNQFGLYIEELSSATNNHGVHFLNDPNSGAISTGTDVNLSITTGGDGSIYTNNVRSNFGSSKPHLQIEGTSSDDSSISLYRNNSGSAGPILFFGKSAGASVDAVTAVGNNHQLLRILAYGADGTTNQIGGEIRVDVDGSVSSGVVPGKIVFRTANSSGTLTEAVTIDASQSMQVNGSLTAGSITGDSYTGTDLTGTGDDIVYATSGGQLTRSTVEISSLSNLTDDDYTMSQGTTSNVNVSSTSLPETLVRYTRIGNQVTVYFEVSSVTPSSGSSTAQVSVTIPVSSNFTGNSDMQGSFSSRDQTTGEILGGIIRPNATNDDALLQFFPSTTNAHSLTGSFNYLVK